MPRFDSPAALPRGDTLFFDASTRAAVLIRLRGGSARRVKRFRDAHAALDWCIAGSRHFVYVASDAARRN